METYRSTIEIDGDFFAGYHCSKAVHAERTYMSAHFRIVHIISGSGQWKIKNTIYDVRPDDIIFFGNITPRQIVSVTDSPLVYELVGFTSGVFPLDTGYVNKFYSEFPDHPLLSADRPENTEIRIIFDLLKQRFSEEPKSRAVISSLITAICAIADEYTGSQKKPTSEVEPPSKNVCEIMEQAIRYIEQNLCEIKSVSEVADSLHISRGYFCKIFRKYVGYTPKYFINYSRIVRFISLVSNQNITVLDAAMLCGFNSAAGFYKTFNSICGMPPKDYLSQL